MQKLLRQLQESQSEFSPAQKAVADYIVSHYMDIPFQTISQIAQLTGTSETTISKFCNELGFSGFSGFKRLAAEYVNNALPINNRLENTAASMEEGDAVSEIMRYDIDDIQATLKNPANLANIQPFLAMVDQARHVYTLGGRSASFFAAFFAFKLRQQDVNVSNIEFGVGDYVDKMMMIRPGDLVIAFSFSRYTKKVVEMVRRLKQRGVSIVLLTSEGLSPAFEYADLVFTCRTVSRSYVASYTACLSLLNTLLITRALRHKVRMEEYLKELERNLMDFDMFC
ncbi:MurR/RpiR family transcriptional regulator [Oscillibacter sp. MSJ-2]|uniref:MurR/RpiR family transcriptional regulator n=1 Tax=Dysosmobacter acutus TaxID=2841504 RepID=A0ABS6F9I3_9FIRM|nr:MurR/RpiR family transcriptional regulator [Dysosmobacter acutus]MBU5626957.1 MurR/RpiR family transcriptional regulator [Dysosmobacter acutus]